MNYPLIVQYGLSGITVGSIYAIVAVGFNIIYSTTGIINFAQGEFLIIGAMMAISLYQVVPLWLAIVLAVIVTTILGGLMEIVFIRPVRNASVLRLIVITIGLSILIREAMLHIWDEQVRSLPYFTGTSVSTITILGAHISPQVLWVLGVSAVIVGGLTIFFRFTLLGRAMRACADDRMAACLCGINDRWMITLSFMLSAGIGALAGCVISPVTQTQYDMGAPWRSRASPWPSWAALATAWPRLWRDCSWDCWKRSWSASSHRHTRRPWRSWSFCWSWSFGRPGCSFVARSGP